MYTSTTTNRSSDLSTTILHRSNKANNTASTTLTESSSIDKLREKDAQIIALQNEIKHLTSKLSTATAAVTSSKHQQQHTHTIQKRNHKMTPFGNVVFDNHTNASGKPLLLHERSRMGRNASLATAQALHSLTSHQDEALFTSHHVLVSRILEMFKDPQSHLQYLNSTDFAKDILKISNKVQSILEKEPRVTFLQSPVYVFGDIHGNLEDLHFFSDNIWRLGISLTAGNFLFLGDYVDRGMNCLECIAYLLALKLLHPHKIFLLRGNHETRDVNGWEEHYGRRSFIFQCRDRFGDDVGYKIWETVNQVFDRLPLAAVIDQDVFCVHGGIPRPNPNSTSRILDILSVPKIAGINPPYEHEDDFHAQISSDCIWSDPASEQQEKTTLDPKTGFGESLRGGGAICFGHKVYCKFENVYFLLYGVFRSWFILFCIIMSGCQ